MSADFLNINDYDKYLREHGSWFYDNGRAFKGQSYSDSYVRNERLDGNGEYTSLILLCRGPVFDQGKVIHVKGRTQTEIWVGPVETKADIDALQLYIEQWDQSNLAAT